MTELTISDWLMISTVLIAPLLAVQAQKRLDRLGEGRRAKLWVFSTLMATRDARVSLEHVRALNSIEILFGGRKIFWWRKQNKKEKRVIKEWREYHDHLSQKSADDQSQAWSRAGNEFFLDLLEALAAACHYDFDRVMLRRSIYSPVAFGQKEEEFDIIRRGAAQILRGERPLPVYAVVATPKSDKDLPPDEKRNGSTGKTASPGSGSEG